MSASAVDTVSPADIPVIDIAALADPGSDVALAVARRLCAAYEHLGFAYVAGHGVPQALADACMAQSVAFHAATPEQKRSVAINRFHRGYMTFASSTVVTSMIARNRHPNLSESFLVMHDLAPDDPDLLAGKPLQGPNQWPDWLPGFKPAVLAYMAAVEGVARQLLHAFCAGLALPRDALDPLFARPTVFLRLLHYPPHPADAPEGQYGSAPHTDFGGFTLLAQDGSGGLQVRAPDGSTWIDAPPLPGTFVLNLGDLAPRWTNGRLKSTPHRVLNVKTGRDRYSMPFFFDPSMDATVACLPGFSGPGNPPRFPPVRYGDYLMERIDKNYAYRAASAS